MQEDFLQHYGIMGMKWGVRNAETRERYARNGKKNKRKTNDSEAAKIARIRKDREAAYRRRSVMSNAELDRRIKRLEKEKRLRELTASEVGAGKSSVKEQLGKIGMDSARTIIVSGLAAGTAALIKKKLEG